MEKLFRGPQLQSEQASTFFFFCKMGGVDVRAAGGISAYIFINKLKRDKEKKHRKYLDFQTFYKISVKIKKKKLPSSPNQKF